MVLMRGNVDAIIGRYTEARAKTGMFPTNSGALDSDRAFSVATGCLLHNRESDIDWQGNKLKLSGSSVMALPRGYHSVAELRSLGFSIYETDSLSAAHQLVIKGKVDASITNCDHQGLPEHVVLNPYPISSNYGYLIFSKQFFSRHQKTANRLWENLKQIDKKSIYDKYRY